MNPIRQALHAAARHYATHAHYRWTEWQGCHSLAFTEALRGHQVERRQLEYRAETAYAQMRNLLQMAHRARRMMK